MKPATIRESYIPLKNLDRLFSDAELPPYFRGLMLGALAASETKGKKGKKTNKLNI